MKQQVELTVSQLWDDLDNGLTWLKKDDNGSGSIQEKYGATEKQISIISKHPKLENYVPIRTEFIIKDDTGEQVLEEAPKTEITKSVEQITKAPIANIYQEEYPTTEEGKKEEELETFMNI